MLSRKVSPLALCGLCLGVLLCVETHLYGIVKQHNENTKEIQRLQRMNTELSKLFSTNLTALSEARTLLSSLPESLPATIDSKPPVDRLQPLFHAVRKVLMVDKIPYQEILEYASKISKFTSPPPQWDSTRPQQPGPPSLSIPSLPPSFPPPFPQFSQFLPPVYPRLLPRR